MKKMMILFACMMTTLWTFAQGEKNFLDQNYIEVNGKAEMEVTPDLIYLGITINERDSKNKTPIAESEKQMIDKLKSLGIDVGKDLLIKDLASTFKFNLISKTEILLSKEYQLLVRNGNLAAKVFLELEKVGISNVRVERLDHSRMDEFRKEVKINAMKAAKEKAGALAKAIDQSIGRALYIQELDYQLYNAQANMTMRAANYDMDYKVPDLDFEKLKLEYSILARFELK
jgi:uncharacterized protein YggE